MEQIEVKVFGYSLYMNVQPDKTDYYRVLAEKVTKLMQEEASRSGTKSDIKTAIKVAFLLAHESNICKAHLEEFFGLIDQLEKVVALIPDSK